MQELQGSVEVNAPEFLRLIERDIQVEKSVPASSLPRVPSGTRWSRSLLQ